ncbi:hypothetical protein P3X46_022165 [Hevea brasiliensis]|uniref:Aspartic peptidase DDI1-type domain-containing protein n=1 Tax=Hevea brasiliensis TaxID=3981 RepID=A0ABQ9LHS4_HEVBR|nr:hypothetical protein P3X46_022165 [Hevea brasiliensis]
MLENQIAQQASSSSKAIGKLPIQSEMNPREHCKEEQAKKDHEEEARKTKKLPEPSLSPMPSYAKFLKEILSKKRKLEDYGTVALTEECSAILQNKLPPKLQDPGSFSIPCLIGDNKIHKALCDLGASISIKELTPTTISLQLADRSVKYPIGILENISIKVGKFFILVDFVVLKMEEDIEIPIILGRPFLATTRAIIVKEREHVKNGRLTLKVGEEEVEFNLFDTMKHKFEPNEYFKVDTIDEHVEKEFHKTHPKDPHEACIVELKPLPSSLRYAFLDSNSKYPVIINASLSKLEEEKLLRELRIHSKAIGYKIEDLKGINPSICIHRIPMEENNSFKFLFTQKTKKRQHSLAPMVHLHIGECLLVFVMPLLPFKDA